jgi:hypothetical protein
VIFALRVFAERDAAEDVRGGDAGVNTECDERIADVVFVVGEFADRVRGVEELCGFAAAGR